MKVERRGDPGQIRATSGYAPGCADGAGALHQLEDARAGVLQRYVQVGEDLAVAHQGMTSSTRVGVDVVQAHPHAELESSSHRATMLVLTGMPS